MGVFSVPFKKFLVIEKIVKIKTSLNFVIILLFNMVKRYVENF